MKTFRKGSGQLVGETGLGASLAYPGENIIPYKYTKKKNAGEEQVEVMSTVGTREKVAAKHSLGILTAY